MNNRTMKTVLVAACAALALTTSLLAAPPRPRPYAVTVKEVAEAKDANEKTRKKLANYLTDEGVSGRLTWKEYTVNPKAKGTATLLVTFGGRDSVKDSTRAAKIPLAIEKAILHSNSLPRNGKLIILVPDMIINEPRRLRGGRETPVSDGIAKLVRSRMEKHGIDPKRVFATGFSMGGGLVYNLLNEDPSLFSRVLVVGASGNPEATKDIRAEILDCHGSDDDYIPLARVKAFASAVNARHPNLMTLETLPKTGHAESESAAYSKAATWKWLLK